MQSRWVGCVVVATLVHGLGCGTASCPPEYVMSAGACVPQVDDAGVDAARPDSGRDTAPVPAADASSDVPVGLLDAAMEPTLPDVGADAPLPDGCTPRTLYADSDGDTFGAAGAPLVTCAPSVPGYVSDATDCDDGCAACRPGGTEVCDDRNNDCDAAIDEGVRTTYAADCDRDNFSPSGASTVAGCAVPTAGPAACPSGGWRAGASAVPDCDDACPSCFPGGVEVCDGRDQDCVLGVDNGVLLTFYADCDGDTHTPASPMTVLGCSAPLTRPSGCPMGAWRGAASPRPDCIDTNAVVFPGQGMYFETSIAGQPAATDFDYDCDGQETSPREMQRIASECSSEALPSCEFNASGWAGSLPACGTSAAYAPCMTVRTGAGPVCVPGSGNWTRSCR